MTSTYGVRVDPANREQARAWDGEEGAYWAEHADTFDRAVHGYQGRFLDAADIDDGALVLDVGCGTGQCSLDAAALTPSGHVLGVDLSNRMLDVARRRAIGRGLANVEFVHADAQVHPFSAGYDRVISRTGSMFFGDPAAAFANLGRAARPAARMTLLVWQPAAQNAWVREQFAALAAGRDMAPPPPETPGPFSLGDPERVRRVLAATGWASVQIEPLEAPMWFGDSPADAYRFVLGLLGWLLADLDAESADAARDALRATMAAHHTDAGVVFDSATWLVTATRR